MNRSIRVFLAACLAAVASAAVAQVPPVIGSRPRLIDFNADGRHDLVWRGPGGAFGVWLMSATGPLDAGVVAGPGTPRLFGDFNADGRTDIVWEDKDGSTSITLMSGKVVTATVQVAAPQNGWHAIAVGDFNGDGKPDFLMATGRGQFAVWLMNGTSVSSTSPIMLPGLGFAPALVGDFNGDGKTDVLWRTVDGSIAICLMNGAATTACNVVLPGGTGWAPRLVGEFNLDGKDDLVLSQLDGSMGMWLVNGTSVLSAALLLPGGTGWSILATADFNADGKSDLVWSNPNGQAAAWLMNGITPTLYPTFVGTPTQGLTIPDVGDFNGDGAWDVLWRNAAGAYSSWLLSGGTPIGSASLLPGGTGWDLLKHPQRGTMPTAPFRVWERGVVPAAPSATGITYYVDGTNGNDVFAGTSLGAAFRTLAKATSRVAAGDTVLIRAGLYREGIVLGTTGTAAKPITFGAYGDGEVILDGSTAVTGWVNQGGTVWKATINFNPIGVVVNDVPLKQVRQGQNGSTAPREDEAGVTSGSGKWFSGLGYILADFGAVIGNGDPNKADIVVPGDNGGQTHVYFDSVSYVTFKGLTVRGSGSNGIWGYGNNVTVDSCDIKFNGKAAVSFQDLVGFNANNSVLYSHAYHNVLLNWPRGNNAFAEDGGGWSGGIAWVDQFQGLARGNVVHMNGGEGIIAYGQATGLTTGSVVFEQNIGFDNWSVNMYFDNQAGNIARQNLLFRHPIDTSDFLYVGASPYDDLGKYSVCLMLADEQGSGLSTSSYAALASSQVTNNIIAGCRIGIRDYSEGSTAIRNHGLKNTIISNNTIIMPPAPIPNTAMFGIYLNDNKTPSGTQRNANTIIQNNIVVGFTSDPLVCSALVPVGGITMSNNVYSSPASLPFGTGAGCVPVSFATWKTQAAVDANSKFADPLLGDPTAFRDPASVLLLYSYNAATLQSGSPATGAGAPQAYSPAINFAGAARIGWNAGAF